MYEPLLAYNYETRDPVTESQQAYALCYKCHLRRSILADESFSRVVNTLSPSGSPVHRPRRQRWSG